MKTLKTGVYQQIAMNLVHAGLEYADEKLVRQIHKEMHSDPPVKTLGQLGGYARDLLSQAETLPSMIESKA